MAINKIVASFAEAVADVPDGATILFGGFGGPGGFPCNLTLALRDQGARNLTVVCNNLGIVGGAFPNFTFSLRILFENRQVKKGIASFPVSPSPSDVSPFEQQFRAGEVELEMVAQGTLAERIRAAGAGIGGFYTPTGVGTLVEQGKEKRVIDGREYLLELPLKADYAFIRAYKADTMGNLVYQGTQRNFNPVMATAASVTVAEVDEIVEAGEIDPDVVVTPGIFVNRIVKIPEGGVRYDARGPK